MKLENILLREVGALTRCIHSVIEVSFKTLNLQKGQSIYLTRICENPGLNLMQLSRMLMVDKTTASKVVRKLIDEGFVAKIRDERDKRSFNLFPSNKASEVYSFLIREENHLTDKCLSGFSREEAYAVLNMVRIMRKNIEEDWFELKEYNRF